MGLNISIKGYVACWISNILGKDVVQKLGLETAKKQKDLSITSKGILRGAKQARDLEDRPVEYCTHLYLGVYIGVFVP